MPQIERNEEFREYQAASAAALVERDSDYDISFGKNTPTPISGNVTVAQLAENESLVELLRCFVREHSDTLTSNRVVILDVGKYPGVTVGDLYARGLIIDSAGEAIPHSEFGETSEPDITLPAVIELARAHDLDEVADRLAELSRLPFGEDEEPLQPEAANFFVGYCVARQKRTRPLMTVTPTGELDATWKGPAGEKVIMRFFASGNVWVACKSSRAKGSFEKDVSELSDPDLFFNIPDWA